MYTGEWFLCSKLDRVPVCVVCRPTGCHDYLIIVMTLCLANKCILILNATLAQLLIWLDIHIYIT